MSHGIKSINVNVVNNTATIEVDGYFFNQKYTLDRIDVKRHDNGIELFIRSTYDKDGPITAVTRPFHRNMYINPIAKGKYYVRIDNNNKWVKWFDVH